MAYIWHGRKTLNEAKTSLVALFEDSVALFVERQSAESFHYLSHFDDQVVSYPVCKANTPPEEYDLEPPIPKSPNRSLDVLEDFISKPVLPRNSRTSSRTSERS